MSTTATPSDSKLFRKSLSTGFCVVLMLLFGAVIVIPLLEDMPEIQLSLMKAVKVGVGLLVVLALLHLFPLIQHLKNVKNGAPLFSPSGKSRRYQPWPTHSHPVAKNAKWGPVDQNYEVFSKKTRIIFRSSDIALQRPARRRIAFTLSLAVVGIAIGLFPIIMGSLVYEITPPKIEELQKFAYDGWPIFAFWSVAIMVFVIYMIYSRTPLATFDKRNGAAHIKFSRCFGWLDTILKPKTLSFKVVDIAGFQIAYYRSRSLKRNDRRVSQYELILVLSNGKRHLLTKGSSHSSVLKDAIKLARFLGIQVWDRSGYYCPHDPEILSPSDPVLQPL